MLVSTAATIATCVILFLMLCVTAAARAWGTLAFATIMFTSMVLLVIYGGGHIPLG